MPPKKNEVNDDGEHQNLLLWFDVSLFMLLTIYYNDLLLLVYFKFEVNLLFTLDFKYLWVLYLDFFRCHNFYFVTENFK